MSGHHLGSAFLGRGHCYIESLESPVRCQGEDLCTHIARRALLQHQEGRVVVTPSLVVLHLLDRFCWLGSLKLLLYFY